MTSCHGPLARSPLPDELWCRIFLLTLPDVPSLSPHESPMTVSQVCRSWRQISTSYPLLWSTISLPSKKNSLTRGTAWLCKIWLERSGSCPVEVDLRVPIDVLPWSIGATDGFVLDHIMCEVLQHSNRLRRVFRAYPTLLRNLNDDDGGMQLLEELYVINPPYSSPIQFPVQVLPPHLKSLALFNTSIHFSPATIWPKLQHLELWQTDAGLAGLSPSDCLNILSLLPSLVSAGLHICVDDDDLAGIQTKECKLPALRYLVISSLDVIDITTLLTNIDAPVLHSIGFDGCVSQIFISHIGGFISRHRNHLRLLALGQVGMVDISLLVAVASCHSSAQVVLCSSSFDGHASARVGFARRSERGLIHDDDGDGGCEGGCLPHTLSHAFLSEEMWSIFEGREEGFRFPLRTFRDVELWVPYEMWMPALNRMEDRPREEYHSVKVSICKGSSVFHAAFCDTWVM